MTLTPEQQAIKAHFIAERGYWRPWTETILRINPEFLRRYATYAGYPARNGPLSKRMVELIYVALDASSTHLFASGIRTHIDMALQAGATPADILDVLHIVTAQGLETVFDAVGILAEEAGLPPTVHLPSDQRSRVGAIFPEDAPFVAALAQLDPGYLDVLVGFLSYGDPMEGLMPTERTIIEIALSACFTGYNPVSLRRQIRIALEAGVSRAEILQAIQLGAHLSVHGAALGATILEERLTGTAAGTALKPEGTA
ncbi:carboxymuconolactone decarboxylase family protein [Gemmobacter sp.]|uniref:carboxymuconolactone decarboxylase family protein n=1 Tax=Gemmobacter sp. TaxID=1898957 RepID=UPI002AFF83DF|nr:carboxymuconolactone decarboxylase family protein [Gemmobacter sp.]